MSVAAIAAAVAAGNVLAQSSAQSPGAGFPNRPVRLVVPLAAGGVTDVMARMIAKKLGESWGQQVIVDNRPGAGTVIGTNFVAKAPADGYTMAVVVGAHMINPSFRKDLPYDTLKDLAGVSLVAQTHLALIAGASFPANTIAELIALARSNPGKYSYGTPGAGTAVHLAMEMLRSRAGMDIVHVPYKGAAPALQDILGGSIPMVTDGLFSVAPHIKSGKLKVLAVMSPTRVASAPEYPTIAETVPGVSSTSTLGIVVPSATPRGLIMKINADLLVALKSADLIQRMMEVGWEPVGTTPEAFDELIRAEIPKWQRVVKDLGLKVE